MPELPYEEPLLSVQARVVSQYTIPAQAVAPNAFDTRTPLQQVYFWTPDQ